MTLSVWVFVVQGAYANGEHLIHAENVRWRTFERRYRAEMKRPPAARLLDLIAALSQDTALSVGCYCEHEARCHRSVLRRLLLERGALVA